MPRTAERGGSGILSSIPSKILDRLSVTEPIKNKITRTTPADVIVRILQGKGNDIGVYPVSLIIADKRLKLIGVLPSDPRAGKEARDGHGGSGKRGGCHK